MTWPVLTKLFCDFPWVTLHQVLLICQEIKTCMLEAGFPYCLKKFENQLLDFKKASQNVFLVDL